MKRVIGLRKAMRPIVYLAGRKQKLVNMWEEGKVGRDVPQMMLKIVRMRCEQYGV